MTEVPAVEAAAEPPAGDASAETGASSTEPATVSAPVEAQADENDQPVEPPAQDAVEAAAVPDEAPAAPSAPESLVSGAAEAAAETAQTAVETTNETLAQTLAETALLPGLAETKASKGAAPQSHSVHIGASFAFVPSFAPITEINAKLFAFARGEGEAALAHIQALARAKSPAEALRLQVTEMQRAADASLTCFSEIVRSANRLSDSARRH
ncbi:phasin family protein [Methylorubrum aminovorans]